MTLAPLLEQLRHDAATEEDRRVTAARDAAARQRQELEARLDRRRAVARADAERVIVHERQRRAGEDALEQARVTLVARDRFVDRVLAACTARAGRIAGHSGVARALAGELAGALACLPGEDVVIRCHPAVTAALGAAVAAAGRTARFEEDPALAAGFVAGTADGRVRIDASVERRLARDRDGLAIDLVRLVTEKGP